MFQLFPFRFMFSFQLLVSNTIPAWLSNLFPKINTLGCLMYKKFCFKQDIMQWLVFYKKVICKILFSFYKVILIYISLNNNSHVCISHYNETARYHAMQLLGHLRDLIGSALDHRSLPPEFKSWHGHISRVFHLRLLFHCLWRSLGPFSLPCAQKWP